MAKRINILTRYRLEKIVSGLKEIRKDTILNKIDSWNLKQATEIVEQILHIPAKQIKGDKKDGIFPTVPEEGPS